MRARFASRPRLRTPILAGSRHDRSSPGANTTRKLPMPPPSYAQKPPHPASLQRLRLWVGPSTVRHIPAPAHHFQTRARFRRTPGREERGISASTAIRHDAGRNRQPLWAPTSKALTPTSKAPRLSSHWLSFSHDSTRRCRVSGARCAARSLRCALHPQRARRQRRTKHHP